MIAGDRMSLVEVLMHVAGLVGHTKNAKTEIRAVVKAGKVGLVAGELTVVDEAVFVGSWFPGAAGRPVAIANAELPADCVIRAEVNFETGVIMRRQKQEAPVEDGSRLSLPAFAARNVTALRRDVERIWPLQKRVPDAPATINKVTECQRWLEAEMHASPTRNCRSKRLWEADAIARYGISKRAFARAWGAAIDATGATAWAQAGPKAKVSPE